MTDRSILIPHVQRLGEARVLVIGDVMLDQFVYGDVERISPEAPIPVLRVSNQTNMPGGAGNVVRNLSALGAAVTFIAITGEDSYGDEVAQLFAQETNVDARLIRDPDRRTTLKTRYVAGTQQMLRADQEDREPLSAGVAEAVSDRFKSALGDCDVVVLSDYGKGVLSDGRAQEFIDAAKDASRPVIVDPKSDSFDTYAGADLITPNRKELERAAGRPAESDSAVSAAAFELVGQHNLGGLLVTRSGDGMTLVGADGDSHHLQAEAREVFDVSGAGDTVVAAIASMIAIGAPRLDAARLANVAAGIVVGKLGTAVADANEVIAALHHQDISDAEAKVLTWQEAQLQVDTWRAQGKQVGFTNGCFDLLHPGHVSLLSQARAGCDRLIVGLNSDSSVKGLKGESRPVQNEAARSAVLASLASVDLVVIFAEETPLSLIETLKPDVLVKGADYKIEDVVGGELVRSWGGKVMLAELKAGFSTTATIERMENGDKDT